MDYADGSLPVDPEKMKVGGFKDAGRLPGVTLGWFLELLILMVVYPLCFSRLEGSGTEKKEPAA